MDSDLVEAVDKLKAILDKRSIPYTLGSSPREEVDGLKQRLKLPPRYRSFLVEANPIELQTVTPVESIQFIGVEDLLQEQVGFSLTDDLKPVAPGKEGSWRRSWVVIAYGVLGDPYFLDVSQGDAEETALFLRQ
ncbi:MAG: SMI1/KNR4 family protein [Polyangiaceae bacterium]|nr:SMI1/KNR4 family protein [Polyangiaceae bacterium]